MEEMPMKKMIETSLENIRKVADANTVIGEPILLPDGVSIIPFSKVSVGFASGGSDLEVKSETTKGPKFAGGNGAGLAVTPLGFIVVSGGDVRVIDLQTPTSFLNSTPTDPVNRTLDSINGVVDKAPELIMKIKDIVVDVVTKIKEKKQAETEAAEGNGVETDEVAQEAVGTDAE